MKDAYTILGIKRNATDEEIKESMQKGRRHWHPDKNKSPEAPTMFAEITEAGEMLLNHQKRQLYNQGGWDLVNHVVSRSESSRRLQKAPPLNIVHKITLRELYNALQIEVSYNILTTSEIPEKKTIPVPVSQIKFGTPMIAESMGNQATDCVDGDVQIIFQEQADLSVDKFQIDDGDLIFEKHLKVCDMYGFSFPLKHPCGKTLLIESKTPDLSEGDSGVLIYKSYGLKTSDTEGRGNLIVKWYLNLAEQLSKLSNEDKSKLNAIPSLGRSRMHVPQDAVKLIGMTPADYRKSMMRSGNIPMNPFEMLFGAMGGGRSQFVVNGFPFQ